MEEQLVSYETAVLAKEKGFDELCLCCFNRIGELYKANLKDLDDVYNISFPINTTTIDSASNESWRFKDGYAAPTQSLLQKWLRDEHGENISIFKQKYNQKDWVALVDIGSLGRGTIALVGFESYEYALEAALKHLLGFIAIN